MIDILVVEDNLEMATLLCDFLKAEGYSVQNCTDGENPFERCMKLHPVSIGDAGATV